MAHTLSIAPIERCEIIAIGTELLLGQTINSNACTLAKALNRLGIASYRQQVVGDNLARIGKAVALAFESVDLVISCGGLGPTEDDLSMAAMAAFAQRPMVEDAHWRSVIKAYFDKIDRPVAENNWKQALLPEGALRLDNALGTACGAFFSLNYKGKTKYIALLPGPPHELKPMLETQLMPLLEARCQSALSHAYFQVRGIGESSLEMRFVDLIHGQDNPSVAMYAGGGKILVRVSERHPKGEAPKALDAMVKALRARLQGLDVIEGDAPLEERCFLALKAQKLKIAFAESCTAGKAASVLGAMPGASAVLMGGVISYDRSVKEGLLGVPAQLIDADGEVSTSVAEAMALGVCQACGADIGLGITGIAGPTGGSKEKPVGTVCFGLAYKGKSLSILKHFRGDRANVQARAVAQVYQMLWAFLTEEGLV